MRPTVSVALLLLACGNPEAPATRSVLETTATSYVAADDPDPRFDFAVTVIVRHRNTSALVVRVADCTTTVAHARYIVETAGSGEAAWNPDIACANFGTPWHDLLPGAERTDTLTLRAPWKRLFNGEPVGAIEGRFHLAYDTQVCGALTASGQCTPANHYEFARSNEFEIRK